MGTTKKIPYIKDVVLYMIKYFAIYFILRYFLIRFEFFNPMLLFILSLFLAFSINIRYSAFFILSYFTFFYLIPTINIEFIQLFIYLINTIINTFVIMLAIRRNILANKPKN